MNKKLIAIDLFCGAGGLTLGLKQAGFDVLAGVEINQLAAKTYALNHKKTKIYLNDIRELCPHQLMTDLGVRAGELDLLAGCPPCQGFSAQRTRNKSASVEDPRNDLIFELVRFVQVFLPKCVMFENVPALAKDGRISMVSNKLERLGYYIFDDSVQVADAADYGVPQRRKRMIFKASRVGKIECSEKVYARKTVRDAIGWMPPAGSSGDWLHDYPVNRSKKVNLMISMIPKNGGSRSDLPYEYWLPCHKRRPDGYLDVYGRMSWDTVAPTITGGCCNPSKGRFIHPEFDRAITLREAALLQSFPPKYKFSREGSKDAISLLIGNALPPEFIKCHALEFKRHLKVYADNRS
jgi:DNA (cytosine-5)-methyltransferase 1